MKDFLIAWGIIFAIGAFLSMLLGGGYVVFLHISLWITLIVVSFWLAVLGVLGNDI